MNKLLWIAVTAILTNLFALHSCLPAQQFLELGRGPFDEGCRVYGCSNSGEYLTGNYWETLNSQGARGMRWSEAGGFEPLGTLAGTDRSYGLALSGDGQVVVGYSSGNTTSSQRAFRWSPNTGMAAIPPLPGFAYNKANAVSSDGMTVVGIVGQASGFRSFRWTEAGGSEDLGTLFGPFDSSHANGVSNDGNTIVGQIYDGTTPAAYRWTSGSGMMELPPLAGQDHATAWGVNDNGELVVGSSSNPGRTAVVWNALGQPTDLGGITSEALAISDDGNRVVGFGFSGGEVAFLWTSVDGVLNLNEYLPTLGVDLSDWQLERATCISPDGKTIAGYGRKSGIPEGWLFSFEPPETQISPSTIQIARGRLAGGVVEDLGVNDGVDVSIQRSTSDIQAVTSFEVEGTTDIVVPTSIRLEFDGAVFARSPVNQTIEVFDYQLAQWEILDIREASRFSDALISLDLSGDLARFVEAGTGSLRARVEFASVNPRQQFTSNTDYLAWLIR